MRVTFVSPLLYSGNVWVLVLSTLTAIGRFVCNTALKVWCRMLMVCGLAIWTNWLLPEQLQARVVVPVVALPVPVCTVWCLAWPSTL